MPEAGSRVAADVPMACEDSAKELREKTQAWLTQKPVPNKVVHRKKAHHVLVTLDHQLRLSAGVCGLRHWVENCTGGDPLNWPSLSLAPDQESSNVAALSYLMRHCEANIDVTWDISHGCWNDCRRAMRSAGDWPLVLMLMASFAMRHGPFGQEMRLHQLRECMREYAGLVDAESCEWFAECAPAMAHDRHEDHRVGEPGYLQDLWEDAVLGDHWTRKGVRPSLNRFMSAVREMKAEAPLWNIRRHNQVVACLQTGMMSQVRIRKYLQERSKLQRAAQDSSAKKSDEPKAAMQETSVEERALRAASQNLLVVSTLILDDGYNARHMKAMVAIYLPWDAWFAKQNKLLRSTADTPPWAIAQLQGDYDAALSQMFAQLRNTQAAECLWETVEVAPPP